MQTTEIKIGSISAFLGSILFFFGVYLHPGEADPNNALAAFTEYAASTHWLLSHLLELFGTVIIFIPLLLLTQNVEKKGMTTLAKISAAVSIALTSALQAIDGVALKRTIDAWNAAEEPIKSTLYQVAFGIRQLEISFAGISGLMFGCSIFLFGIVFLDERKFKKILGYPAIGLGILYVIAGIWTCVIGFTDPAMTITMVAGIATLIWMTVLGVYMWRMKG